MTSSLSMAQGGRRRQSTLPKIETDIPTLLEEYPNADGRGIKIAVMDTGCDLAAAGLQTTIDGKPKFLDFLDCTGDGDVDMTKKINMTKAESSNNENNATTEVVKGLSGRTLTLGNWANGVDEIRIGAIPLFNLLPTGVVKRLKGERKRAFKDKHRMTVSQAQRKLDEIGTSDKEKKKEMETLLEQLQESMDSYSDYSPLMDVILFKDKKDNNVWRAVLDLEATGDLSKQTPMAPFAHERQMGQLGFGSAVTFCIQVYDDGDILSIVTDVGSHGTHVAGIAAANFAGGDSEEEALLRNGVAPGAQILACKIGDGRLGSAETGTGLIRGLVMAKKYGCDLANLSYGEPSWQPEIGRVNKVFTDAVYKWGVAVFTSASNDGPALSTLGCPGSLTAPITVGAVVSPAMAADQYSTLVDQELQSASYYFSSRGPSPDGNFPDICAPGGAIAPIARHALQGKNQYHGTSMSSPNACGVAACILSAVKQSGKIKDDLNPTELKRAVRNSATTVDIFDPWAQGAGLINAPNAVKYILDHHGKKAQNLAIDVKIPRRNNARGLYIRDSTELKGPLTYSVFVKPRFDHGIERTEEELEELLSFELDLDLKPSASWVKCPERMTLLSGKERGGRPFSIRLEPDQLPPGAHYATIDALDSSDPSRGPLFSFPVTVIIPHASIEGTSSTTNGEDEEDVAAATLETPDLDGKDVLIKPNGIDVTLGYELLPGDPVRRFITVPQSAEWATIKIRSPKPNPSGNAPHRFILHAMPFVRGDIPNSYVETHKIVELSEGIEKEFSLKVKGGSTMEVCLQLLWLANASPASVVADVEFHSFAIRPPNLVTSQPLMIGAATEFSRTGVSAPLRPERLNPHASLNRAHRSIRPKKQTITAGSTERDLLPQDKEVEATENSTTPGTLVYNMHLEYPFKIDSKDAISVTPRVASLFHQLYDSPLDSQLWTLTDSNGQVLSYGSCMHESNSVSLKKGDYTVTLWLRHPDRKVLDSMKDVPLRLSLGLSTALDCAVYSQLDKATTPSVKNDGRSPVKDVLMRPGQYCDLYVSRPTADIPDWVKPGDVLEGTLALNKNKRAVTSMDLYYVVPPKPVKDTSSNDDGDDDDDPEELSETVFKASIRYLSNLRSLKKDKKKEGAYEELAEKLQKENPKSLPLLQELLTNARESPVPDDVKDELDQLKWRAKEIGKVLDTMMSSNGGPIDASELALHFGCNQPNVDEITDADEKKAAKKKKKEMTDQRKALRLALFARSVTLGKVLALEQKDAAANFTGTAESEEEKDDTPETTKKSFESSIQEMKKWVSSASDLSDDKDKCQYAIMMARHARYCQNKTGKAISILAKARKDNSNTAAKGVGPIYKELTKELIGIYKSMGDDFPLEHLILNMEDELYQRFPVSKLML